MPTPDQETQRLLEFSLAEEELHAAIDRVDAFPRQAKALLKTLGYDVHTLCEFGGV